MWHAACMHSFRDMLHARSIFVPATHCNTLQHTATHCNTATVCSWYTYLQSQPTRLQAAATSSPWQCDSWTQSATHCNTLQHTATLCNTDIRTCKANRREFRRQHNRVRDNVTHELSAARACIPMKEHLFLWLVQKGVINKKKVHCTKLMNSAMPVPAYPRECTFLESAKRYWKRCSLKLMDSATLVHAYPERKLFFFVYVFPGVKRGKDYPCAAARQSNLTGPNVPIITDKHAYEECAMADKNIQKNI